jgi:hypothetical protein
LLKLVAGAAIWWLITSCPGTWGCLGSFGCFCYPGRFFRLHLGSQNCALKTSNHFRPQNVLHKLAASSTSHMLEMQGYNYTIIMEEVKDKKQDIWEGKKERK